MKPMGYKTCHALNTSLDASICAKDCERLEKHKFAKDCKHRGGLYKCCIRRDAAFCHECRYHDAQIPNIMLTSGIRLRYKYQVSHRGFRSPVQVLLYVIPLHLSVQWIWARRQLRQCFRGQGRSVIPPSQFRLART